MAGSGTPPVGTPAGMRMINQRAVLDLLRRGGPATRPQVAKDTGLSKPTVSQALLALEAAGLARATGHTSTGTGRSAVLYEADPTAGYVLGLDIGREHIRVAVADLGRTTVARRDVRNTARSGSALISALGKLAADIVAEAGLTNDDIVVRVLGSPASRTRSNAASGTRRTSPAGAVPACSTTWSRCSARTCWWKTTRTSPRSASGKAAPRAERRWSAASPSAPASAWA